MGLFVPFEVQPGEELILLRRKALVVLFGRSLLFSLWAVILLLAWAFSKSLTGNLLILFNRVLGPVAILSAPVMIILWTLVILRWWFNVYVVTSRRVLIREGLIITSIRQAPLGKVQTVTTVANMFERLLRMGNIRIETAGITGTINFDAVTSPDDLQQQFMEYLTRRREEMEQLQLSEIRSKLRETLNL